MKIPDVELRDIRDPGMLDFIDFARLIFNNGRYEFRIISSIPDWTANEGECVIYAAGTEARIYFYINGTWRFLSWLGAEYILKLENRTDDPTDPDTGRIWFRTDV